MAEQPEDGRKRYSVDLYMSTFSTHHVEAESEEDAYAQAKKERQHDLEEQGKDSSTVEHWLNRWQEWRECDTVEEAPSPSPKVILLVG